MQADLVPQELRNIDDKLTVCCVHGDQSEHSTADVYIRVCDQTYLLRVGLVPKLPYPVLLGQDLPVLPELVSKTAWCGVVTRAMAREQENEDLRALLWRRHSITAHIHQRREV